MLHGTPRPTLAYIWTIPLNSSTVCSLKHILTTRTPEANLHPYDPETIPLVQHFILYTSLLLQQHQRQRSSINPIRQPNQPLLMDLEPPVPISYPRRGRHPTSPPVNTLVGPLPLEIPNAQRKTVTDIPWRLAVASAPSSRNIIALALLAFLRSRLSCNSRDMV